MKKYLNCKKVNMEKILNHKEDGYHLPFFHIAIIFVFAFAMLFVDTTCMELSFVTVLKGAGFGILATGASFLICSLIVAIREHVEYKQYLKEKQQQSKKTKENGCTSLEPILVSTLLSLLIVILFEPKIEEMTAHIAARITGKPIEANLVSEVSQKAPFISLIIFFGIIVAVYLHDVIDASIQKANMKKEHAEKIEKLEAFNLDYPGIPAAAHVKKIEIMDNETEDNHYKRYFSIKEPGNGCYVCVGKYRLQFYTTNRLLVCVEQLRSTGIEIEKDAHDLVYDEFLKKYRLQAPIHGLFVIRKRCKPVPFNFCKPCTKSGWYQYYRIFVDEYELFFDSENGVRPVKNCIKLLNEAGIAVDCSQI